MKKFLALSSSLVVACALFTPATEALSAPSKSCVTLYEHINYRGKSYRLCWNDPNLVNNDWNDIASSAKVTSGKGITLYEHVNYKGARKHLRPGNYNDFRNLDLGNNRNWNDVVSSVKIR